MRPSTGSAHPSCQLLSRTNHLQTQVETLVASNSQRRAAHVNDFFVAVPTLLSDHFGSRSGGGFAPRRVADPGRGPNDAGSKQDQTRPEAKGLAPTRSRTRPPKLVVAPREKRWRWRGRPSFERLVAGSMSTAAGSPATAEARGVPREAVEVAGATSFERLCRG